MICLESESFGDAQTLKANLAWLINNNYIFKQSASLGDAHSGYHCYITNTSIEQLGHEKVSVMYALRWQVEICFKILRQYHSLDQLPSQKEEVVLCLVWASILSNIVSGRFYEKIKPLVPKGRTVPLLWWMEQFAVKSYELLLIMAAPKDVAHYLGKHLLNSWLNFMLNPNINRIRSLTPELFMLFS